MRHGRSRRLARRTRDANAPIAVELFHEQPNLGCQRGTAAAGDVEQGVTCRPWYGGIDDDDVRPLKVAGIVPAEYEPALGHVELGNGV